MNIYDAITRAVNVSVNPDTSNNTFSTTITGDGVNTLFAIAHNLNTLSGRVLIIDNTTNEEVLADIIYTNKDTYNIEFGDPPEVGKTYKLYVIKEVARVIEPPYVTLDEPYIMKTIVNDTKEYAETVDIKVNSIHTPMERNDVDFRYEVTRAVKEKVLGSYRLYRYYPIGSTISLDGVSVTVLSYTTPIKLKNEWYVTMYGSVSGVYSEGRITDIFKEDKILKDLTDIVHANNDIKRLLKYYDSNIIDLIGSSAADAYNGASVILDIEDSDRTIYNGYQAQLNDDLDNETNTLVDDVIAFRSFYDAYKDTIDYGTLSDTVNTKSLLSWIFIKNITDKSWSDVKTKFSNLTISCIYGGEVRIKYEKFTGGSSSIVIYTPSQCKYNVVLYVDSFTTYLGRVTPSFGFAIIDKSGTSGETTTVELSYAPIVDTYTWLANLLYHVTGNGKAQAESITEYFDITLRAMLAYVGKYEQYTTATFERYQYTENGYIGNFVVDGKSLVI